MMKFVLPFLFVLCAGLIGFENLTRPLKTPSFEEVKAGARSSDFVLLDRNGDVLSRVRHRWDERALDWVT